MPDAAGAKSPQDIIDQVDLISCLPEYEYAAQPHQMWQDAQGSSKHIINYGGGYSIDEIDLKGYMW